VYFEEIDNCRLAESRNIWQQQHPSLQPRYSASQWRWQEEK